MTCNAITRCTHSCLGGNCERIICNAESCSLSCAGGGCNMMCNGKRCEQTCTRGGCGMKCHGQICEQRCTRGNCQLACPRNAMKCQQTCEINRDKCERFVALAGTTAPTAAAAVTDAPTTAVTTVAVPTTAPAECNRVRNRTCYQYCTRGGCTMECQKSPYYDSCVQSCTGRHSLVFIFPFG